MIKHVAAQNLSAGTCAINAVRHGVIKHGVPVSQATLLTTSLVDKGCVGEVSAYAFLGEQFFRLQVQRRDGQI